MQPPTPTGNRPATPVAEKMAAWLHWLFDRPARCRLCAGARRELACRWTCPANPAGRRRCCCCWPPPAPSPRSRGSCRCKMSCSPRSSSRSWAARRTRSARRREFPSARSCSARTPGPKLFKTLPWALPLIWIVAILNSRGVARLILRPWRKIRNYGFWLIGLTAVLTVLFDLALDPFAARVKHYWLWVPTKFPLTWQGAPLVNFLSWAVVSLLILAFVTPVLINKHPVRRRAGFSSARRLARRRFCCLALASAPHGLWPAVVLDGIIGVAGRGFRHSRREW